MGTPFRTRQLGSGFDITANPRELQLSVTIPATALTQGVSVLAAVFIHYGGTAGLGVKTVLDSRGNPWVVAGGASNTAAGHNYELVVLSCTNMVALQPGDTITLRWTTGSTTLLGWGGSADEFSDLLSGSIFDVGANNNDGGAPGTAASSGNTGATTYADEVLYGMVGTGPGSADVSSTPAGWTDSGGTLFGSPGKARTYFKVVAATGVQSLAATLTASDNWEVVLLTFKSAAPTSALKGAALLTAHSIQTATADLVGAALLAASGLVRYGSTVSMAGAALLAAAPTVLIHGPAVAMAGAAKLSAGRLFELWNDLGLLWGRMRNFGSMASGNLAADLQKILSHFRARPDLEGIYAAYAGYGATFTGLRQALGAFADVRLTDRDRVLRELKLTDSASLDTIFDALALAMTEQGVTLNRSTVTVGAPAYDQGNKGNGTLLVTTVLDGVNPPVSGGSAHRYYSGLLSELAVGGETMTLRCTADSESGGAEVGAETFSWNGDPASDPLTWDVEGSGDGPSVQVAGGTGVITGGDFESWSNNVPDGWSLLGATVAGTHTVESTVCYRGTRALQLTGDGVLTIGLTQPATATPLQRYLVAVRVLAVNQPAAATLTIGFTGTGYIPAAGEKITIAGAAFPLAWTLYTAAVNAPADLPDDWALTISLSGMPAGVSVWIDDVLPVEVVYFGGVGVSLIPGSVPWNEGDSVQFSVVNDQAGVMQELFRRKWAVQLPSSASPTVLDSVAS